MTGDADYAPIGDYALIGDCHSAALVGRGGSIDWACLQRFDAGSVFGRLLDVEKGGTFALRPSRLRKVSRRYLPRTNVLETTMVTETGAARIFDCFTMRSGGRRHPFRQLLRVVEGMSGRVAFDVFIQPRFDYATTYPWLRHHPERGVFSAMGSSDAFVLSTDCPLVIDSDAAAWTGEFTVERRGRRRFSIVSHAPHEMRLHRFSARVLDQRLRVTIAWWRAWADRGRYHPAFRDALIRSALVLKALTCAPTGAIIAAPTTSLPEVIGGERNWDYRYSWVRDATLAMSALFSVGHPEVATGFQSFIERTTTGRPQDLQIMYGCYGERRLNELELDYLAGYRGSRPVRIGNAAFNQTQLDVYGEVLLGAHLGRKKGKPPAAETWRFLRDLVDVACVRWQEPDCGLWEMRGPKRHFVHSKVMCWVAIDCGIHAAEEDNLEADVERWRRVRAEIRHAVDTQGVDPERGCFVQAFGSREVDAALLALAVVGFVEARDPRMLATVDAIRNDLTAGSSGLLRRYRAECVDDGVGGGEGCFLMVSFWLVDVLAMQGETARARELFDRLLGLANDLGLFSEQYAPAAGQLLGNFPQAFTHLALINSADQLARATAAERHQPAATAGRLPLPAKV